MTNLEKKNDKFFTVLDVLEVALPSEITWSASDFGLCVGGWVVLLRENILQARRRLRGVNSF